LLHLSSLSNIHHYMLIVYIIIHIIIFHCLHPLLLDTLPTMPSSISAIHPYIVVPQIKLKKNKIINTYFMSHGPILMSIWKKCKHPDLTLHTVNNKLWCIVDSYDKLYFNDIPSNLFRTNTMWSTQKQFESCKHQSTCSFQTNSKPQYYILSSF
jgi:hypothetical protein